MKNKKKIPLWKLQQRQALPLDIKIELSKMRIREWYEYYNGLVYISFSGGKDSTVLLHLVRSMYPDVPAVFVDTGLEYPEIKDFVRTFDNTTIVRPEISFKQVLDIYGFPVISKKVARQVRELRNPTPNNKISRKLYLTGITRTGEISRNFKLAKKWRKLIDAPFDISEKCCDVMKKKPMKKYERETKRKPFIGTMADNSLQRKFSYMQTGCNNFKNGKAMPMSFWLEKDVWDYIKKKKLEYCSIYNTGVTNTGCIYCMFGIQMDKSPNRFQCMKKSHPQLYSYCINKLKIGEVLDYIDIKYD